MGLNSNSKFDQRNINNETDYELFAVFTWTQLFKARSR